MSEAVNIVRCAKHGQQLAECFVCGAAVEQVSSMVPEAERDALAARVRELEDLLNGIRRILREEDE